MKWSMKTFCPGISTSLDNSFSSTGTAAASVLPLLVWDVADLLLAFPKAQEPQMMGAFVQVCFGGSGDYGGQSQGHQISSGSEFA